MSEALLETIVIAMGSVGVAYFTYAYKRRTVKKRTPQDRLDYILDYNERQLKDRDARLETMQKVIDSLRDEVNELRDQNAELLIELKRYRANH